MASLHPVPRPAEDSAFSLVAQRLLSGHAVDPAIAASYGVVERDGHLVFGYRTVLGERVEHVLPIGLGLASADTIFWPPGQPRILWWPQEDGLPRDDQTVLLCECELDALAALTSMAGPGGDRTIKVAAIPDGIMDGIAIATQIASITPARVFVALRHEPATGRQAQIHAELLQAGVDAIPVQLGDQHLSAWLSTQPQPNWAPLEHLLVDCVAAEEERRSDYLSAQRTLAGPVTRRCDDMANAERLVHAHGNKLRFQIDAGKWMVWNGASWAPDRDGEMLRRAMRTAQAIHDEVDAAANDAERKALRAHAVKSGTEPRLKAMIRLAQVHEKVVSHQRDFDADPWLLNCANGIVDLRTGRLLDHDPEKLCSQTSPVLYDPEARSAAWDTLILDLCNGDHAMVDWVRRAVGYTLTGSTRDEVMFYLVGPGGTGKSTFLNALRSVLGDYALTADISTFQPQKSGPRNDLARLQPARLVVASESDQHDKLSAGLVKSLTGGDEIVARYLFQENFSFTPRLKLWMASNYMTVVDPRDSGLWRRLMILPCENVPDRPLHHLKRDLSDVRLSGPAILAWAIEGALEWQRRDLRVDVPPRITDAIKAFRNGSDPIGGYLSDPRMVRDTAAVVAASELYDDFQQWCGQQRSKLRPVTRTEFGKRLATSGLERRRDSGGRHVYVGLRIAA